MKYFFTSVLLLYCSCLAYAITGQPQGMVGIVGNVKSIDNRVLAKASVVVVYVPTGARRTTTTDEAGNFTVGELAVGGPYTVQVSQTDYQPEVINDIFLLTGKTANGTFVLHPEEKAAHRKNRKDRSETDPAALLLASTAGSAAKVPMRQHLTYIQQCSIIPSNTGGQALAAQPARRAATVPKAGAPAVTAAAPAPAAPAKTATPPPAPAAPARTATPTPAPAVSTKLVASTAAPAAAAVRTAMPTTAPPVAAVPVARPAYRPGSRSPRTIEAPAISGHFDAASGNYIYDTGAPTTLQLADGRKISGVGVSSTESLLHRFVADPKQKVDTIDRTKGWLSFDRVYFDTGKASLTKESMQQLRNIATMLQSYPQLRLKLGGYTDSVGTYQMNRQLSEARARTAWTALVDMGVSPARLEARGYGPNYPIASNQTPAGRAMNRRLSLRVLSK